MGRKQLPSYENLIIEDIAAEGKSLVRIDNRVVFVTGAVPGDRVDLKVFRKKKGYMEARVTRFHELSEVRTEPFCEHFGICGGCKWQQLPYSEQLKFKERQVLDALKHIGGIEFQNNRSILGSEENRYYRNKLEYTFSNRCWLLKEETANEKQPEHTNALGFHVPGRFDRVVDINWCFLQKEPSNRIRNLLRTIALEKGATFYDQKTNNGLLRNLIIRTSSLNEVMVLLSFQYDEPVIYEIMKALKSEVQEIDSLMYAVNPKKNETLYDLEIKTYAGKDHIFEQMGDLKFKIGPKSFFQTNSGQAIKLLRTTAEFAGLEGHETVYDLYTGTGTIANYIARNAGNVVGIESVPEAIQDAVVNSEINKLSNTRFVTGDIKESLNPEFTGRYGKPDVIIADPPRAGIHPKVLEEIKSLKPEKFIYVSCNPATQARDIRMLSDVFRLKDIQPVDMFPHTHHVENIALLTPTS
ncbi:MAG: 23S rRNA (uracil(1939)-C(5))-methyltransferase RlmD [Bacteroidales bacterium]|nr:23S rRNA (uracil(1939)-C(5))-methyltransferase RlmD [Bacteroidales bacterium]